MRVAFAVADTGPGIPPGEAERLFGEFEQADTALTRRHGGAGLGLAISRRIVERMGGELTVEPRPGGGSVFRFALDLEASAAEGRPLASLAGRRVLVVMPDGAEPAVVARWPEPRRSRGAGRRHAQCRRGAGRGGGRRGAPL